MKSFVVIKALHSCKCWRQLACFPVWPCQTCLWLGKYPMCHRFYCFQI